MMESYRIKAFLRSRRFIVTIILVLVIAAGTGTTVYFLTRPTHFHIFAVGAIGEGHDVEQRRTRDFAGSRLWMHSNGTFSFRVTYRGNNEFVGIGRWTREGNQVTFHYEDLFRRVGTELWRDHDHSNWTATYLMRRGVLHFYLRDPDNRYFFFRR